MSQLDPNIFRAPREPVIAFRNSERDALQEIYDGIQSRHPVVRAAVSAQLQCLTHMFAYQDALLAEFAAAEESLPRQAKADFLQRQTQVGASAYQSDISMMADFKARKLVQLGLQILTPQRVAAADHDARAAVKAMLTVREEARRARAETWSIGDAKADADRERQERLLAQMGVSEMCRLWDLATVSEDDETLDWLCMVGEMLIGEYLADALPKKLLGARTANAKLALEKEREDTAPRLIAQIRDRRLAKEDEAALPLEQAFRALCAAWALIAGVNLSTSAPWFPRSAQSIEEWINKSPDEIALGIAPDWLFRSSPPFATCPVSWTRLQRTRYGENIRMPFEPADPLSILRR